MCGANCPLHTSHPFEIKEDGEWVEHLKIHDKPTYFSGDKMFCGAECSLKWYQERKKHNGR